MNTDEAEILRIYQKLMAEVLRRTESIGAILNKETGLEARFAREAAFLHLRMICESVALGCIIAHEGFSDLSAPRLGKSYAADQIMNELTRVHQRFYPQPIVLKEHSSGRLGVHDSNIEHLSKDALISLYRECGKALHRGTPTTLRRGETIESGWVTSLNRTTQLIVNLLGYHALVMRGDDRAVFCDFSANKVWAATAI